MAVFAPSRESVIAELHRVLGSTGFEASGRSRTMLSFLVEETLAVRADRLKEYTIGVEALGKGESFDPRTDPIVRAEISRLRGKLERYYAGEGRGHPIVITLPKGSYIPQFLEHVDSGKQIQSIDHGKRHAERRWLGLIAFTVIIAAAFAAVVFVRWGSSPRTSQRVAQLSVALSSQEEIGGEVGTSIVISPDGTRVVFVASGQDGVPHLHLRRLENPDESELPGTDGARVPFFSPDGAWVGFWAGGKVKKIHVDGGAPVVLCDTPDLLGASWGDDGQIVASFGGTELFRFSSDGGKATAILKLAQQLEKAAWPQLVGTQKIVVFTALSPSGADQSRVEALSLQTGKRTVLISGGSFGRQLTSSYLTYVNQGTLYAVRFKADEVKLLGPPLPVLAGVSYSSTFGYAELDFSETGDLVFRKRPGKEVIAQWIGPAGRQETMLTKPGNYLWPRLSPDGKRLAMSVMDSGEPGLVVYDTDSTHFTPIPGIADRCIPLWTPNGHFLILGCAGTLMWVSPDGARKPEILLKGDAIRVPWSFSPDGSRVAYHELGSSTGFDIWTVPVHMSEHGLSAGTPEAFRQSRAFETYPAFSPDGRWIAFASNESGTAEVYVRAFPDNGSEVRVSTTGGLIPFFSPSGHQLFYRTGDQRIMAATYTTERGAFVIQSVKQWTPTRLADTGVIANLDLDSRHNRFLGLANAGGLVEDADHHATFVFNFGERVRSQISSSARSIR
jgi:eukaryotic-like serine/threonine-protein kinase